MSDDDDTDLETFLAAARRAPPAPSAELMARVLADAREHQRPRAARRAGWLAPLGGLPGLGGLVTATCVGFWIGLAPPASLPDVGALVLGEAGELAGETDVAGFGWAAGEEG